MSRLDCERDVRTLEMSFRQAETLDDLRWRWDAAGGLAARGDPRCVAAKDARKADLIAGPGPVQAREVAA